MARTHRASAPAPGLIDAGATGRRVRASVGQSEHNLRVVVQDQVHVLLGQSALADVVERLLVRLECHQHRVVAPRDDTIRAGAYFATGDKSYKPRPRELATDVAENFLSYKLSPPAALVRDFFKGKTIEGKPFTPARAAASVVVPMQIADFVEAYQQEGFPGLIYSAPGAVGIGYQNYQQPGAVEITPQLGKEFEKHGLKFDTVPTIPGDTEKTQTARAQRVQQWINQYGHELINNSRFQRLDEDQQTSALNNLRRRVMSQANLKNPRLNVFRSSEVIQSVLRSERAEPIRNRRKIVIEAK